jgi:tRNA (guanine37-N1)-methyltransferase
MRIDIITLFPGYFAGPFACGPVRIAQEKSVLSVVLTNPRDFTTDPHRTVDDYPFGGGAGMVLKPEPVFQAVEKVRTPESWVVLLSPQGRPLTQPVAEELSRKPHLVLVCGRYKAVDERVTAGLCQDEVSVGDFILSGGEAAACCVVESVTRLLPGAVGDEESVATDSFSTGMLDAPYYTRPAEFRGMKVPEVLLSGNHAAVGRWRRTQALARTMRRRPELLAGQVLTEEERDYLMHEIEKEFSNGKEEARS